MDKIKKKYYIACALDNTAEEVQRLINAYEERNRECIKTLNSKISDAERKLTEKSQINAINMIKAYRQILYYLEDMQI